MEEKKPDSETVEESKQTNACPVWPVSSSWLPPPPSPWNHQAAWQRLAILQQQHVHLGALSGFGAERGVTMAATSAVGSGGRT